MLDRLRQRNLSRSLLAALVIFTALTVVRFNQSLWSDEATSVWFSRQPIASLLTTLCDPHPPAYYLLLKFWTLFGTSEAWLRVPSLLASLGAIIVAYEITRRRQGQQTAALVAGMLALQPLQSWYGSEVRMYAPVQFAGLLLVWLGWGLIDRGGSVKRWLVYGVAMECTVWLDYTAMLPIILLQLMWLMRGCPHRARWIVFHVLAALPVLGWWLGSNQWLSFEHSYQPVFVAVQAARLGINLTPGTAAILIQLVVVVAIGGSLTIALMAQRRTRGVQRIVQSGALVIWIGLLIFSIAPAAFTLKRLVVVGLPYIAIASASLIARWPVKIIVAAAAINMVAAALTLVTLQRDPWRPIVQELALDSTPHSIWVDELSVPVFDYYWRQLDANSATHWTPLIGQSLPALPSLTPPLNENLSIVTEETEYRRLIALLPDEFWAAYAPLGEQRQGNIAVYQYQRRPKSDLTARPPVTRSPRDEWGLLLLSPLDTCTP